MGARQDDGFPNWPFAASRAWTIFTDNLKVVRHGVEEGFGAGAEIYHALNHEGTTAHLMARTLLRTLQSSGDLEVPLRRYHLPKSSKRRELFFHLIQSLWTNIPCPLCVGTVYILISAAERVLSSFYTLLCGPEPVPVIDALPSARPVPWKHAPVTCLDIADLINERAGRMFPGEPEYV